MTDINDRQTMDDALIRCSDENTNLRMRVDELEAELRGAVKECRAAQRSEDFARSDLAAANKRVDELEAKVAELRKALGLCAVCGKPMLKIGMFWIHAEPIGDHVAVPA